MPNPEFTKLLERMQEINDKKSGDYTSAGPFQNFDRSAELASWFKNNTDKAFVVLIGTKLARLATLLDSGKTPNNEPVSDSFLDLCTYCALWASYHATMAVQVKRMTVEIDEHRMISRLGEKVEITIVPGSHICATCNFRITNDKALGQITDKGNLYYHLPIHCPSQL